MVSYYREQLSYRAVVVQISRSEALASIRRDYDVNYFVSGVGDMEAYEPDWSAPWQALLRTNAAAI